MNQVIESCYHGNRDTRDFAVGGTVDLLGSLFFVPVEFCSTIYCNENNVAMATEISL